MIGVHDTRRTRVILAVLLVLALALITFDYRDGSSGPAARPAAGRRRRCSAARSAWSAPWPARAGFFDRGSGAAAAAQVAALQRQVVQLRAQLSQAQLSKARLPAAHQLLQLSGRGGYRIVAATVIAIGQGYQQTVTLDAGSADGVKPRRPCSTGRAWSATSPR